MVFVVMFLTSSLEAELNGIDEQLEPKGKEKKDSGEPPKPTGPRKG